MQLSLHADYALRVLLYAGSHPAATVTTRQISEAYGISRNHLVRVVHTLSEQGYVKVTPGRSGGLSLAKDPGQIRLGQVVRYAEPNLRLVECFDRKTNTCPIIDACGLKAPLRKALDAFLNELDQYTLGDLLTGARGEAMVSALVQLNHNTPVH